MKLIFSLDLSNDLEQTLAAARYKQFWEDNQERIQNSFYKHTGLTFHQKQIAIHLRKDGISKAGNKYQAMELSMTWKTEDGIGCTLIHELAHRLVIGNGIDPPDGNDFIESRASYYMHRHIYLFLHDVLVDVLGEKIAREEIERESNGRISSYAKAWSWAMAKNYKQRQKTFEQIKKRHGVKAVNLAAK